MVDSWYYKADQIQEFFPETPFIRLLLYCPLARAFERLDPRNEQAFQQGNIAEKRYIKTIMESLCAIYTVTKKPLQPMQGINKEEIESVFADYSAHLINEELLNYSFTFRELTLPEFRMNQNIFLTTCEADGTEPHYITPIETWDFIFNSHLLDSKAIMDFLKNPI